MQVHRRYIPTPPKSRASRRLKSFTNYLLCITFIFWVMGSVQNVALVALIIFRLYLSRDIFKSNYEVSYVYDYDITEERRKPARSV